MSRKSAVRAELRSLAAEASRADKRAPAARRGPMSARDLNRTPSPIPHRGAAEEGPHASVSPFWVAKAKQQARIVGTQEWAGNKPNRGVRVARVLLDSEESEEPPRSPTNVAEERRRQRHIRGGPRRSGTVEEQALAMLAHQDAAAGRLQDALLGLQGAGNDALEMQAEKHAAVVASIEARFAARQEKMVASHKQQLAGQQREKVAALAQLATAEERHRRAMAEVEASVAIHQNDIEQAVQVCCIYPLPVSCPLAGTVRSRGPQGMLSHALSVASAGASKSAAGPGAAARAGGKLTAGGDGAEQGERAGEDA
eukprot:COSAG05_NODE_504_length_9208_cov_22.420024_3_plen_312_part_00